MMRKTFAVFELIQNFRGSKRDQAKVQTFSQQSSFWDNERNLWISLRYSI